MTSSQSDNEGITFADCAPLLVVTEESVADVSSRLEGETMDVTKFRPNVVLRHATKAYEEDYWAELDVGSAKLYMTQNCIRCQSLNVDFSTGKMADGESGKVLKKLMKDRRIDAGAKYSPVFGRYGFLGNDSGSHILKIGDTARVLKRNEERTTFGECRWVT
jgi:glycine hydroxymethyltransferase